MGMSASQARLIALNSKLNDIEYQGQQINQQRTYLSNQTNELYNSLLEMSVPTPPVLSSYQKLEYSGTLNASKFTLGNVVPTGKNESGDNTYSAEISQTLSGHSVSQNMYSAKLSSAKEFLYYKEANLTSLYDTYPEETLTKPGDRLDTIPDDADEDVLIQLPIEEYNKLKSNSLLTGAYDSNGKEISGEVPNGTTFVYVKTNASAIKADDDLAKAAGFTVSKDEEGNKTYTKTGETTNLFKSTEETHQPEPTLKKEYPDNAIVAMKLSAIVGEGDNAQAVAITTYNDLVTYIKNGNKICVSTSKNAENSIAIKNPNYDNKNSTGYAVGDMRVYSLDSEEAKNMITDKSYSDYITALKNAFADDFTEAELKNIAELFFVYFEISASGQQVPHFIKKSDTTTMGDEPSTTVKTYEYDKNGTYTHRENIEDCQMEFDPSTGRITKIGIPKGDQIQWVELTCDEVSDTKAYNEAMNQYEYQKILYDKKQQDVNSKTSIIQQQDKNLELKLTRLDNERTQITTEIEAVEKVIKDDIDSSYKTFSG